jgi:hypothetical protein
LRQSEDLCKVREEGLSVAPGGASDTVVVVATGLVAGGDPEEEDGEDGADLSTEGAVKLRLEPKA